VFRNAVPLKDPTTGEILGYEAQYVQGKAGGGGSETARHVTDARGQATVSIELVPATIDITLAKEEIRMGDRLLPEPPREVPNYVPRRPLARRRADRRCWQRRHLCRAEPGGGHQPGHQPTAWSAAMCWPS
jgi:hypothetical protein